MKIIEDLKNSGLIEREENIMHRTPLCERSKTPIEIIPLQDYYVTTVGLYSVFKKTRDENQIPS